ncbi:DUF2231 domain-containing protein [Niabella ginsengisoli]|uniref:DUF2231 domain-containing protein n=1 Tax=Niabella ginsengisoli TaxID=522298 RepID=A0ABS9SGK3_9BACT|nr:DUF2231 domain-containing protein [Niabella ginsengisoli]MCH5597492.1 hypothetical protein [Niabella ginsengisoli]
MSIDIFLGRFHPLLVHLPIGFLLLAAVLQFTGALPKFRRVRTAVPLTLLAGCLSAIIACVTGYLLSLSGDYNMETLDWHMWMGIITAIISFLAWLFSIKVIRIKWVHSAKLLNLLMVLMMFFISVAGHYGGSLTHGSDYLSTDILFKKEKKKKKITNVNEALVFEDIVHPILIDKCGACHNADKKKGKLSIESLELIKKVEKVVR